MARGQETARVVQVCSLCDECWLCVCSFLAASSCSYSEEVAQIESANPGQPCCGELGPDAGGSLGFGFGAFEACAAGLSGVDLARRRNTRHAAAEAQRTCSSPVFVEDLASLAASLWTRAQIACVILLVFKGLGSEKDPGYLVFPHPPQTQS